jgi:2,3-bisphosphoglycerate-dependent phosphoglycerate mutase
MGNVLVLVRHGQSEWNKKNLFTGWKDVGLTEEGEAEARRAGQLLAKEDLNFDIAFTSALSRAQRTLAIILAELGQSDLQTIEHVALNERDYGDLVGLDKDEARKKWGDEQVHIWRRSFDIPPPGGESLKDTADRVLPYFEAEIAPLVTGGKSVIVSAHGNSLRALVMRLDGLSRDEVTQLNLATGAPILYRLNDDGTVAEKRNLAG